MRSSTDFLSAWGDGSVMASPGRGKRKGTKAVSVRSRRKTWVSAGGGTIEHSTAESTPQHALLYLENDRPGRGVTGCASGDPRGPARGKRGNVCDCSDLLVC